MKLITASAAILLCCSPINANAKQLWSDTSVTLMKGTQYEVGDTDKTVFTLEHAGGHSWGSVFAFVDRLSHSNDNNHEIYGEFGANITLKKLNNSVFKDVYLATQWEFSSDKFAQFDNYLVGVGTNLSIPKFNFANITYYRRNNELGDNNNQLTFVWSLPVGDSVIYDGFIDAIDSSKTNASGFNFTSQLKYDVGQHIGIEKNKLYAGIEYVYWKNKFGIDGVTEKNPNIMVKWHF